MQNKINALVRSRRFWLMVSSILFVASNEILSLELSEDQVTNVVLALGAWIVGDSLRET